MVDVFAVQLNKKRAWTILEIITGLAYLVFWDARE
jgi:hypothetical protein